MASAMGRPCETRTSTCRSFATISSGLYRFLAIAVLLDVKDIPQVGPLQWGWIRKRSRLLVSPPRCSLQWLTQPRIYEKAPRIFLCQHQEAVLKFLAVEFVSHVSHARRSRTAAS